MSCNREYWDELFCCQTILAFDRDVVFNNRTGSRTRTYNSMHYQLININYMNSKNSNKEAETKQIPFYY